MISNGLVVGMELQQRQIKQGVFYEACGREETLVHRFWQCPHSVHFWEIMREEVGSQLLGAPRDMESFRSMRFFSRVVSGRLSRGKGLRELVMMA